MNRRSLITGLISFVAAPAIVRASSLMPVKVMDLGGLVWPAFEIGDRSVNGVYVITSVTGSRLFTRELQSVTLDGEPVRVGDVFLLSIAPPAGSSSA